MAQISDAPVASTIYGMEFFTRVGNALISPIPKTYAAGTSLDSGTNGWKDSDNPLALWNERTVITEGDADFDIGLPPQAGREAIWEVRWISGAGPTEVSRVEIRGTDSKTDAQRKALG